MSKYISPMDVWNAFGEGAFNKVRNETLQTTSDSTVFEFAKDNLISSSEAIYTGGTQISSGFTINYDDGKITFASAPGVVPTADYNYAEIPNSQVLKAIASSEEQLEMLTGRNFDLTTTSEFLDVEPYQENYWLANYPVTNIISISTNEATSVASAPQWLIKYGGLGEDYLTGSGAESHKITFINNFPPWGLQRVKVDYVYGYSTIPDMVQELNVLLAKRKLMSSGIDKSIVSGDTNEQLNLRESEARIMELKRLLGKQSIELI